DTQKRIFIIFEESEIFIATCCHHFILLACNMVKSGELYVRFYFNIICIDNIQGEISPCNY
ncbi:hypothetical protein HD554DRAFT_2012580, partial [Boletus coccyginus]